MWLSLIEIVFCQDRNMWLSLIEIVICQGEEHVALTDIDCCLSRTGTCGSH